MRVHTQMHIQKHTFKTLAQHPVRLSRDEILVTLNSRGKMQVKSYRQGRREALNTKRDGSPARGIQGSLPDHRSSTGIGRSHPPRSDCVKVGTGQEPDGIWICIFIRKARIKRFRDHSQKAHRCSNGKEKPVKVGQSTKLKENKQLRSRSYSPHRRITPFLNPCRRYFKDRE